MCGRIQPGWVRHTGGSLHNTEVFFFFTNNRKTKSCKHLYCTYSSRKGKIYHTAPL